MDPTNSPRDVVNKLAPTEPGAPAADDHDRIGPPAPEVIARGYELDTYDTRSVLSVPLLVILFFVLAFGTVTVLFNVIAYPKPDGSAHPIASETNKAPLTDRLKRNYRGPTNGSGQPGLEPARPLHRGELARAFTQTPVAGAEGNSPELHPEDLRLARDKFPALYAEGAGKLPFDKSGELSDDALKAYFPVQAAGTVPANSRFLPTGSNAGRGAEGSVVVVPELPKPPAPPVPPVPPKGGKP